MADKIFQLTWHVPAGGYEVIETWDLRFQPAARGPRDRYLVERESTTPGRTASYQPFVDHTGLFRTLSELELTERAIVRFADRYGNLGGDLKRSVVRDPDAKSTQMIGGERVRDWMTEITRLREAVELLDLIGGRNTRRLSELIEWRAGSVRYRSRRGWMVIASEQANPERLRILKPGSVLLPARMNLQDRVNARLSATTAARLLFDHAYRRLGFYVDPGGLIGAAWVQLARAIDAGKEFRSCLMCRTWFELSSEISRGMKQYCSNACRQKAYRARQR